MEGSSSGDMARRPNVIRRIEADRNHGKNVNHAIWQFSIKDPINPILPIIPMTIGDQPATDHTANCAAFANYSPSGHFAP